MTKQGKIYIGITATLGVIALFLAYRYLFGKGPADKRKEQIFQLLDTHLQENKDWVLRDPDPTWRRNMKIFACKHNVTFEQGLARNLAYIIETGGLQFIVGEQTYTVPLDILLQWRDARDGRSPYYGTHQFAPECTADMISRIYAEERPAGNTKRGKFGGSGAKEKFGGN
ncbi:hypothetical protein [Flavihumibacter sp. CACIAM 22H1]|uniref:hypothetical protein n=1 Tax=Flavihumibacter sp. CACIAM 22H1 TaxID=1812911 RepID=UPI0007A892EA|nr:hypothetical protein [Flavihumibacter sp. CACIAM 22H1]KYP13035.1 MAG: hypothetical protein A1D16_04845 [Flavihumibacter sp. CACIAM 22H1]